MNKVLLCFLTWLLISKYHTNLGLQSFFCRTKLWAVRGSNVTWIAGGIESQGVGEEWGEACPLLHEAGGHFMFPLPRQLLPVSKPGSNPVPALASLCKREGTDGGKQVAPRYAEVLPESGNLGRFSASFLCFFILSVQMRAVPLPLSFYSPLFFSSFFFNFSPSQPPLLHRHSSLFFFFNIMFFPCILCVPP